MPVSPEVERRSRMLKYTVMMSIRVVCIALCVIVPGWWAVIPAVGAIVLPYLAVVVANTAMTGAGEKVARPSAIVRVTPEDRR
ncbi:DUF3099 domain-containing protein [Salinibacterium sp. ZJ70]|uniref:DUF3099 domain-containing protein n=1 Tax=Salinibacterium sp. ZJ70 TaxID=2708084 RepID=UPI001CD7D159|nr:MULTISPECIES: DUF3099 domain-containing protein [unclassified Salinibacterium]